MICERQRRRGKKGEKKVEGGTEEKGGGKSCGEQAAKGSLALGQTCTVCAHKHTHACAGAQAQTAYLKSI